jgi:hypothetical protein
LYPNAKTAAVFAFKYDQSFDHHLKTDPRKKRKFNANQKYLFIFLAVVCIITITVALGLGSKRATPGSAPLGSRPMTAGLMQFSLSDMAERADKIFRGTVVDFSPGTVAVGSGELPVVIYRLWVQRAFKGSFEPKGDGQYVELRFVGSLKGDGTAGDNTRFNLLPTPPELLVDHDYLLFTTPPSAIGLSTAVGLGQGSFEIFVVNKQELAKNAFDNAGLYDGAVPYSQLVADVEALVEGE